MRSRTCTEGYCAAITTYVGGGESGDTNHMLHKIELAEKASFSEQQVELFCHSIIRSDRHLRSRHSTLWESKMNPRSGHLLIYFLELQARVKGLHQNHSSI
ncbi:hypothetical protein Fot_43281 [Forsythia ovata]|uniref:Uncharacterized protein n=1 Tax=Forsythia ovata TaxID=205694 RepID=A0ABD1RPM7_9LAMI